MTVATGLRGSTTVRGTARLDFADVVTVPDAETRQLFDALSIQPDIQVASAARAWEPVAIAAGLWVGGARPLLGKNDGLMEAGDTIRGCGLGPRIPLRLLVGWRRYPGAVTGRPPIDSAFTCRADSPGVGDSPPASHGGARIRRPGRDGPTRPGNSMPTAVAFGMAFRR